MKKILLIAPPFTQLNTPYPATAYLKGFLNTIGHDSYQTDLAIEVILQLFSKAGLQAIFEEIENNDLELSDNSYRIFQNKSDYIETIEPVILFLQNKNSTLAHSICARTYLPEAYRFENLDDLDWAFGTMGSHDKARHLATLYLEDLGDLIKEAIDPNFGFSRYAERLGRTATHFDELEVALNVEETLVTHILLQLLEQKIEEEQPDVVAITIPFPGNLFAALKCGQYIKEEYPHVKVIIGGGYVNTELRKLYDERVFDYVDFVSLDDGEAPLQFLLEYLEGKRDKSELKRVFMKNNGVVSYYNGAIEKDVPQRETGTPDYSDLFLEDYLSVIEIVNPMHRLWSDGRWNKLTLAHGCYWGKCSFCDVTLDYIQRYEPLTASILCDRIETIIEQTDQNGFHFVDEAAPPALMRDLAIEILRRKLTVVWWTNIRFEKSFTADLCRLLKASGCIAVSGGLEVASDRLLARMKKGVTVAQVARVADHFTSAGIMVHAYLMYGFPTQTAQETIDSLEMVRQLFENGVVQSGFWHRFAMTAHSPVGLAPAQYEVVRTGPDFGGFADNDLYHDDPLGGNHDLFAEGLRTSLFNYMHGQGFDLSLSDWFDMSTPKTSIVSDYIEQSILPQVPRLPRPHTQVLWLGNKPDYMLVETKGGMMLELTFHKKRGGFSLLMELKIGEWLVEMLANLQLGEGKVWTFGELQNSFFEKKLGDFGTFLKSGEWEILRKQGMLILS